MFTQNAIRTCTFATGVVTEVSKSGLLRPNQAFCVASSTLARELHPLYSCELHAKSTMRAMIAMLFFFFIAAVSGASGALKSTSERLAQLEQQVKVLELNMNDDGHVKKEESSRD